MVFSARCFSRCSNATLINPLARALLQIRRLAVDSSLPPVPRVGSDPVQLVASVRTVGQLLSQVFEDPQPEALARLHSHVAILDRVSRS